MNELSGCFFTRGAEERRGGSAIHPGRMFCFPTDFPADPKNHSGAVDKFNMPVRPFGVYAEYRGRKLASI